MEVDISWFGVWDNFAAAEPGQLTVTQLTMNSTISKGACSELKLGANVDLETFQ